MTTSTGYAHIETADDGTPRLAGTRISVARIALDHIRGGEPPEAIASHYQGLTLGEVYSALAYYFDHRTEMEQRIAEDRGQLEEAKALWADSQTRLIADLKARGKLP
jgi:uncharacterized protein (DUF433 family)